VHAVLLPLYTLVLILLIYWMVTEAYSALLAAGISTIAVAPGSNCDDFARDAPIFAGVGGPSAD